MDSKGSGSTVSWIVGGLTCVVGGVILRVLHDYQGIHMDTSWRAWAEFFIMIGISIWLSEKVENALGSLGGASPGDSRGVGSGTNGSNVPCEPVEKPGGQ